MNEKRKIVVLGPHGMLGQMAVAYFRANAYDVAAIPLRYKPNTREAFISELLEHPKAVVINAIGRIKQKTESVQDLLWANTVLPLDLANRLLSDQVLIQPSSDCVFSGADRKPYAVTDIPNALDDYGWSKRLGEVALLGRPNTLVLRVSIIGPDDNPAPKGLLGWFLSQPKGCSLRGYTNHYWNGITTLEWCRQVEGLLKHLTAGECCRLIQLGTAEHYTKHQMLNMFQEVYQTDNEISEFATPEAVDRRLTPDMVCKPLREQLLDLRNSTIL